MVYACIYRSTARNNCEEIPRLRGHHLRSALLMRSRVVFTSCTARALSPRALSARIICMPKQTPPTPPLRMGPRRGTAAREMSAIRCPEISQWISDGRGSASSKALVSARECGRFNHPPVTSRFRVPHSSLSLFFRMRSDGDRRHVSPPFHVGNNRLFKMRALSLSDRFVPVLHSTTRFLLALSHALVDPSRVRSPTARIASHAHE